MSDKVLIGELPAEIKESLEQWSGCVAGALEKKVYLDKIRSAGFVQVKAEVSQSPLYVERGVSTGQDMGDSQAYLDLGDRWLLSG